MNDLELEGGGWRDYPDLNTDSLWLIPKRCSSGLHKGDYHGNFVPQIAKEFILRYTRVGQRILDVFCGSGTSLIEAKRLGRTAIGFDINDKALDMARDRVGKTVGDGTVYILKQDCLGRGFTGEPEAKLVEQYGGWADLVFVHPPYHDIIVFNETDDDCLSRNDSVDGFYADMGWLGDVVNKLVKPKGHVVLVMGDSYAKGEWEPMAFRTWEAFGEPHFKLKAIVVKDMQGNEKAKGKNKNLWRYRHLKNGSFEFKHEYIFLMRKGK